MKIPKDILTIPQLDRSQIEVILAQAFKFKNKKGALPEKDKVLKGKSVALIFEKNSLRTKVAFEAAVASLGGHPIYLTGNNIFVNMTGDERESTSDITKNLDRLVSGIVARVNSHAAIEEIAHSTDKPVINALCDRHHPTQALADIMALQWHKGEVKGLKVAFVGDGNNVATSLMDICAILGVHFSIASPAGFEIPKSNQGIALKNAARSGAKLEFLEKPEEAVASADAVYTDTFVSMGEEGKRAQKLATLKGYQVNGTLMSQANNTAVFMHCLPAHRGFEVAADVIDGPQSIVFDEAECRLHVAKSLLYLLFQ